MQIQASVQDSYPTADNMPTPKYNLDMVIIQMQKPDIDFADYPKVLPQQKDLHAQLTN